MRVYSWNMYCYNKLPEAVIEFVRTLDADILCMQEVPSALLGQLTKLFPYSASAVDSERMQRGKDLTNYNLILSKFPLTRTAAIPLDEILNPLRAKITVTIMAPAGWAPIKNRNSVMAVAETPQGAVQVFCAHFTLASPSHRAREFAKLLTVRDPEMPAIIAGDFNILEHPRVKPLSWFLGASIKESLPSYPERRLFEERFTNAQLANALRGSITHNFSKSQLDHVLVSESLIIKESGVHSHLYGSDHYPVFVDIHPHD